MKVADFFLVENEGFDTIDVFDASQQGVVILLIFTVKTTSPG